MFKIGDINIDLQGELFVMAGPCVIESEKVCLEIAEALAKIGADTAIKIIFKASFDKANRSSVYSFRGPGIDKGLEILAKVRAETGFAIMTDIHEPAQAAIAAEVVDCLQIPAFLCRQTDLIVAASLTGRPLNIKKGQFMAPWDMVNVVKKAEDSGAENLLLTERGVSFGYNNLVVDFKSIPIMRSLGYPVVFDATHSVQLPGGQGSGSGGTPEYIPVLASAAAATGVEGFFFEVHDNPEKAPSDGANSLQIDRIGSLLEKLLCIRKAAESF